MPSQYAPDFVLIEAISVVFAALMVWLSALVQHFSNMSHEGHNT